MHIVIMPLFSYLLLKICVLLFTRCIKFLYQFCKIKLKDTFKVFKAEKVTEFFKWHSLRAQKRKQSKKPAAETIFLNEFPFKFLLQSERKLWISERRDAL